VSGSLCDPAKKAAIPLLSGTITVKKDYGDLVILSGWGIISS